MGVLATALTDRLATRRVTVETGVAVEDVVVREGRAVGVRTSAGVVDADAVVVAVDPRLLPALASYVERTMPSMPPVVCHVGLEGELPEHLAAMPHETVLHGDPMLVVRTGGTAPPGHAAWTVHGRGRLAEDILRALARHGIDLRAARRRARRPHAARDGRALGQLAARRALAGPGDGPAAARPGDPGQRACTPRARTPPPAAGCRSSGCRPPWSRRRSARREFHRPAESAVDEVSPSEFCGQVKLSASAQVTVTVEVSVVWPGREPDVGLHRGELGAAGDRRAGTLGHVLDLAEGGVRRARPGARRGPAPRRTPPRGPRRARPSGRRPRATRSRPGAGRRPPRPAGRRSAPAVSRSPPVIVSACRASNPARRPSLSWAGQTLRSVDDTTRSSADVGGRRDDRRARRLRTRQRLGHPGRPVDGRDPDDGGVGDGGGRPVAGDGDGARHAGEVTVDAVRPGRSTPRRSPASPWTG